MSSEITSATPRIARTINNRLALDLLQRQGPLTAAQLRSLTGLSRATISDLLARLQQDGLIEVRGSSDAVQPGPNARLYQLRPGHAHVIGLDARSDSISIGAADVAGNRLPGTRLAIGPGEDPAAFIGQVVQAVRRISRQSFDQEPNSIAVGAPGVVEPATGTLRSTGWPPEWHAQLVATLRAGFAATVLIENEVNLAAIAEHRLGAARDRQTFALLWIGQGVGAGLILDGRLRRGESGGAGEVGFLAVPEPVHAPPSRLPGLHGLIGAAPVCDLARRHGLDLPGGSAVHMAASAVAHAAREGLPLLDELAGVIADGVLALCLVLDPGCVVLGGEIGRAGGAELASRVGTAVARRSPVPAQIRVSELTDDAVLTGAVSTALDHARDELYGLRSDQRDDLPRAR
ncbi:ROK family transcriptional regulator [Nonomuraea typhae]|uniref:ROK family transcriptional regulator n=1 Tax=Nonomuraea typhae TaxID=2603600 RepID=UPI0012F7E988|nr:ROK family transcriptional regulator [Nonomuraea typhae]